MGEFDYDLLREKLQGLAKDVLVELWIDEHQRLNGHGLHKEAAAAYSLAMQRAEQEAQRVASRREIPGKPEGLSGIDILLRDGLLSFMLKISHFTPPLPLQVVKLKNVTYTGKVTRTSTGYETVGTKLMGCLLPCFKPPAPVEDFSVLSDFSAFLMPGSITLVCGPPGCGKTSVHKAVAGRLEMGKSNTLKGEVTFNNFPLSELKPRRLSSFVAQTDQHMPDLTVLETCKFAQDCSRLFVATDHAPLEELQTMIDEELGEGVDLRLQFVLYLLGLRNAANTIVGSKTKRGVSGGERHRVTTAEMLSGSFPIYCFDEISTGLDSSATYDIVSALRTIARVRQSTLLFSLLQPPPDVFNLFDRLIVIHEGRVIYQGPREDVLHYFEALGYTKPPYVDTADFIQEVPTDSGLEFLRQGMKHLNAEELESAYKASPYYAEVMRVLDASSSPSQVTQLIWAEAAAPLGLTFKEGPTPGTVEVEGVAREGPLAEADIAFTSLVAPGDVLTALETPQHHGQLRFLHHSPPTAPKQGDTNGTPREAPPGGGAAPGGAEDSGGGAVGGGGVMDVMATLGCVPPGSKVLLQLERPLPLVDAPSHAKYQQDYARSFVDSTMMVVHRQFILLLRNRSFIMARLAQMLILGLFAGTLFFQVPTDGNITDMTLRLSVNFFSVMTIALGSFSLIPALLDERAVVQKQLDARMYRPACYVIANSLAQIPFNLCEVVILAPLIYWLTGMSGAQNGSHFVLFFLIAFLVDIMGGALVRMIASISPTREVASSLTGLFVVTFLLFTGFVLLKNSIPPWWIWFYYIDPFQYAFTAVNCNEFLSGSYSQPCSSFTEQQIQSTAPYCAGQGDTSIGVAFLTFFELPTSFAFGVWLSIALIFAFYIVFTCLTFFAVANIRFNQVKPPPPDRLAPLPPLKKGRAVKALSAMLLGAAQKKNPNGTPSEDPHPPLSTLPEEPTTAPGGAEGGPGMGALGDADRSASGSGSASASAPLVGSKEGGVGGSKEKGVIGDGKELDEMEAGGGGGGGGVTESDAFPRAASVAGVAFVPSVLSWHDLVYEVDIPGERDPKQLLKSISGFAKPGTMTALMGSSGAGKTTLLDVLAGRKTMGRTRGEILINGFPKVQATFARISGYVEQNDIHTPFITIRESLEFSASLRLPRSTSPADCKAMVDEAMDLLELNPIARLLVGFIGQDGLTVEQAKRLSIGVELVSNPSILFLDEPTSGLDSRAAQIVIRGVENIVSTGRSVICTIHQPSRRLFYAFDHLYLMKRGGEVVYFGPLGPQGSLLVSYFESLPGLPKCSEDENPATYMLSMIGAGIGHAAQRDFALDYTESILHEENMVELDNLRFGKGDYGPEPKNKGYAASWLTMLIVVTRRQYRTYWRNVTYSWGRMMFSIVLGLLLGSAFWQISSTSLPAMSSRQGLIYVALVFVAIVNANNVIPQVNAERPVYYREKASDMYPAFFYDNSWGFVEFPYLALSTLIFCAICFSMTGVATYSASAFFLFWFIFFLYAATITFFGILMAVLTPNAATATVIIPVVVSIWNLTSGFMIPKNSIPSFWIWLYWLNPTQFALKSLLYIAFYCDTSDTSPCGGSACVTTPSACPSCTCPRLSDANNTLTYEFVNNQRSLTSSLIGINVLALLGFILAFRFGAFLALRFMQYNRR